MSIPSDDWDAIERDAYDEAIEFFRDARSSTLTDADNEIFPGIFSDSLDAFPEYEAADISDTVHAGINRAWDETIREEIRSAGLSPASEAELGELDRRLAETLANNAIEGIEPDPELAAMLAMVREERLSPRHFDRFYDRYISEWTHPIRQ